MTADDDQRRLARLATVSALLVVASFLAAKAARDATLLARFSIKSLPLFIGVSAALSLPIIIIAGKLMVRFGPMRLVPAMNLVSGLSALAEWVLITRYPRPVSVITFFHLNIASAVLVSGFWSIVNERFDIASAKKHIGRIGMGATVGGILGGVIAERTSVYLQPDAILGVLAVMQIVCAVILFIFGRGQVVTAKPIDYEAMSTWTAMGGVVRSSLLRKAGLVVVVTAIGAGALDYVFKADIVGHQTHADLLRQLAVFYTVTNIITAVFQVVLTGPILNMLGVPRSVSTLPYVITGFSLLSWLIPLPVTATIARGSEFVTRNSIYRAGYELLYAPLPTEQKRPTKVVLDVGADKIGDILSAQLVALVIFFAAAPRTGLLLTAVIAGAVGIFVTLRLPRAYTSSLESSLLEAVAERSQPVVQPTAGQEPLMSLTAMPSFGHPGDVVPLQLRKWRRKLDRREPKAPHASAPHGTLVRDEIEHLITLTRTFRSGDNEAIKRALAEPLPYEVLPLAIELVASDDDEVAKAAILALRKLAPITTGLFVDVLLDQAAPETLRRRMPGILAAGSPSLAAWGLWRGLADPSFDVRYYCSTVLSAITDLDLSLRHDDVFEYVRKELGVDPTSWRARKLTTDPVIEAMHLDADLGLSHVFRVLGLVLPAEPLRVALHAVQTDDKSLRGMALEYLESILPADVRAQLWPLLDEQTVPQAAAIVDTAATESLLERMRVATSGEHPKVRKTN